MNSKIQHLAWCMAYYKYLINFFLVDSYWNYATREKKITSKREKAHYSSS